MRIPPALKQARKNAMGLSPLALGLVAVLGANLWAQEVIIDNDEGAPAFQSAGSWTIGGSAGYNGGSYIFSTQVSPAVTATWQKSLPQAGLYEVFAGYLRGTNRPTIVPYTITHRDGTFPVSISQNGPTGIVETSLGIYPFQAANGATVQLNTNGSSGAYMADAIILRRVDSLDPIIARVGFAPEEPTGSSTITFETTVFSHPPINNVRLFYGSLTPSNEVAAVSGPNASWSAAVPPQAAGSTIQYKFTATNAAGNSVESETATLEIADGAAKEFRVIWADSWNVSFLNATQAQEYVNTARTYNMNTLMPQVRKVGDALYNSAYEPRATNISGGSSFDPLGYLINLAHDTSGGKKRLEVHAWFVMHRIATKSQTLHPQHPLSLNPEWEMFARSATQPPFEPVGGTQRYLDPGHPEVVDYNIAVILDCMSKYNIDGVNLDYIRYPEPADGKVHGYNPVSIARFNAVYNRTGIPLDTDAQWRNWRRECVTLAVKKLYIQMWKQDPSVILTADTINWGSNYTTANFSGSSAYASVYQDWKGWLEAGIIDYNALMNYVAQTSPPVPTRYQGWTNLSTQVDGIRGSIIGIGAYQHSNPDYSAAQLLYARQQGAAGLNIYDWGSEVAAAPGFTRTQFYQTIRDQVFQEWAEPPVPEWKANPVHGIIEGHVFDGLTEVDHAQVEVVGIPSTATVTDGKGWFGILHLPPGNHTLRVRIPGKPDIFYGAAALAAGDVQTVVIGTPEVRDTWGIF